MLENKGLRFTSCTIKNAFAKKGAAVLGKEKQDAPGTTGNTLKLRHECQREKRTDQEDT